jgi:hypothetical protein
VWANDVRLQLGEINLYDAVKITAWIGVDLFVGHEEVVILISQLRQLASASSGEVGRHALVIWEYGGGRAQLSAHIGNSRLAGGANRAHAWSKILDDGIGAA